MADADAAVDTAVSAAKGDGHGVSLGEATRVWARIAALSFGGPAGQIAVMHRILVEEKRWVGERRFLHALSYRMLLPGLLAIMALSWLYAALGNVGIVQVTGLLLHLADGAG